MYMTWNYRIIHHDKGGHSYFAIHEVFYDDHGKVTNWTADPIYVSGENKLEVNRTLEQMLEDTSKTDVLLESELEESVHGII